MANQVGHMRPETTQKVRTHSVVCNICDRSDARALFSGIDRLHGLKGRFEYVRCLCGLVYMNPQIDSEDSSRFYPADYNPHLIKQARASKRIRKPDLPEEMLASLGPDSKVLDVGCGSGDFLNCIRHHLHCRVSGVDTSQQAAFVAKQQYQIDVFQGRILDAPIEDNTFDLVTAMSCIEHMNDPAAAVRRIWSLCKPKGWFYLKTPNFNSLAAKWFKDRWYNLDCPRHLYLFTPATIKALLTEYDFRDIHVYHDPSAKGLVGSLQYAAYGDNYRPEVKDRFRRSSSVRAIMSPLAHLAALLNRADTIMVSARKTSS